MALLITILSIVILATLIQKAAKHTSLKRTEQQKQVDELITVILPTINQDK